MPTRLLLVDDNEDVTALVGYQLTKRGYEYEAVNSGRDALSALKSRRFDAVFLDITMPGMSGLEVLKAIREEYSRLELIVLMTTGLGSSADMVAAFQAGANDYVTKPIDLPVALARLESQLSARSEARYSHPPQVQLADNGDLLPGSILDERYRIGERLGEGGFAVVYAGVQESTGQAVAIKVMRAYRLLSGGATAELARFELEMRVIASIEHRAVVRLIDSGAILAQATNSAQGLRPTGSETTVAAQSNPTSPPARPQSGQALKLPYIVMERLVGQTLADYINERAPLPVGEAIDLMLPILDGVQRVHELGIIHRDAKPSNILLAESNGHLAPKILDFGIAKLADDDQPALTHARSLVGTPGYMSPEQVRGEPIDGRSDQYTLAVVLLECLTGRRPYRSTSNLAVLQEVGEGKVVRELIDESALPAALRETLKRATAAKPVDRFPDLAEFAAALTPLASSDPRM